MPLAATWMDIESVTTEWSKTEKDKHDSIYVWNIKKNDTNESICKTEIESQI